MGEYVIKLPDVGEGVAEAELVEWLVEEGGNVREDETLAAVMTDKATVEIPSPVEGKITWLGPKVGETVAVGSAIIRLQVDGEGNVAGDDASMSAQTGAGAEVSPEPPAAHEPLKPSAPLAVAPAESTSPRAEGAAPLASPAVRRRALDNGVDLRQITGSGPAGRITHPDLDRYFSQASSVSTGAAPAANTAVTDVPIVGLRRKIAEKMSIAKARIPHITYVDDVDVTALEETRAALNATRRDDQPKITILPFLMKAMHKAIAEQPKMNALFDDEAGVVRQYGGLHMGVAAQTDNGLLVPVVRHVETLSLWDCARELTRLAQAAKTGTASRDDLSGSTITITSLGALGGIVTTPVINHPEVAIIGVNKIQTLPTWDGRQFVPRQKMNLSSSFDHRVIDGWEAAVFIQRLKGLLEAPATIFVN